MTGIGRRLGTRRISCLAEMARERTAPQWTKDAPADMNCLPFLMSKKWETVHNGYSFAFQLLGYLVWERKGLTEQTIEEYKAQLFELSYDKIWNELSPGDRRVAYGIACAASPKVQDIEKKRELIVLMICGFSTKAAKAYIYRDSIVLTAMGIVLGIVASTVMGGLTIFALEPDSAYWIRGFSPLAALVDAVGAGVFAAAMLVWSLKQIDKFELTDISRF